jgi:septal ring factor EnvC (AmiA/AmiB activator)
MRVFTEESLRENLLRAGFSSVRIAAEDFPEFGIRHAENWSLPMVARKGHIRPPAPELARGYRDAHRLVAHLEQQMAQLHGEYERYIAHHQAWHKETTQQLVERHEWGLSLDREKTELERELIARTEWAQGLDREIASLRERLETMQAERARLEASKWTRIGRKLGAIE